MPFYKFIMEKMRLNQFLGYAVYCLFIAYIVKYFEDLYKEDGKPINKDDLLNDDAAHPLNMRPVESQKPIELIKMPEAPNQGDKDDELLCTIWFVPPNQSASLLVVLYVERYFTLDLLNGQLNLIRGLIYPTFDSSETIPLQIHSEQYFRYILFLPRLKALFI